MSEKFEYGLPNTEMRGTHVLLHKESAELVLVTPVFIALRSEDMDDYAPKPAPSFIDVVMYQEIGLLFENKNAVNFVLPHTILEHFEILGRLND